MPEYLSYSFQDTPAFVDTFDELPLWSAPFGQLLLQHVPLRRGITVLDIGSGAGFPLLELAERLGHTCTCYGLDPWTNANTRARKKIAAYGIRNAEAIDGTAEKIPFDDNTADLIVSSLGINNFDDPGKVFAECARVLKPGGTLALTTNLDGHWKEFYAVFSGCIATLLPHQADKLRAHEAHRGSAASVSALFTSAGLSVTRVVEDAFTMRFLDGSAMLNHHFVKLGWLGSWKELIPENEHVRFFTLLEEQLNALPAAQGGLTLTVPMCYIEGKK